MLCEWAIGPAARLAARQILFPFHAQSAFAALLLLVWACGLAAADALDGVPLETRARLAVAASAYPPGEAPDLDPASPSFAPDTAADYLESDSDGLAAVSLVHNGHRVTFSLLRFPDSDAAAAAMQGWKANGDAVIPLGWGGRFEAFRRGQGLLGIGLAGAGIVARGQSGRWHFEVGVQAEPGATPASSEVDEAIEAMKTLAANAVRYRLFPRELSVEYQIAGGSAKRLAAGQRLQLPLSPDSETSAVISLQVLDDGNPVKPVSYRVELTGSLASLAELEQDGSRARQASAEVQSADGSPAKVTFVFPPATDDEALELLDAETASLALKVEARTSQVMMP